MNDRSVIIDQDININEYGLNEVIHVYTDVYSLSLAYKHFCSDLDCAKLIIKASEDFDEACKAFNSLFKRIEAAGGIVRDKDEKYLFIKRFGIWDLPKGKLHKKETVQEGALREVTEETGLTGITITKPLPSTFHIYTDRNGVEVLKETYWFEMMCHKHQELIPQLEEDITEVKWFDPLDLNIPMMGTYSSIKYLLEDYLHH